MIYESVQSSNIAAIAHDGKSTLGVKLNNGGEYHYHSVPTSVFEAFRRAQSKGQFFDSDVKKKGYKFTKVK